MTVKDLQTYLCKAPLDATVRLDDHEAGLIDVEAVVYDRHERIVFVTACPATHAASGVCELLGPLKG